MDNFNLVYLVMNIRDLHNMSEESIKHLQNRVQELYLRGGRQLVCSTLEIKYQSLSSFCNALKVDLGRLKKLRSINWHRGGKYNNPFSEEVPLKYYLIGFILGDGCLSKNNDHYRLNISQSDKPFMEEIAKVFGAVVHGPNKGCYSVDIEDDNIGEYLESIGFLERKSFVGMNLPPVPDVYFYDFMRGLLDSDGSIIQVGTLTKLMWFGHASYLETFFERVRHLGYSAIFKNHTAKLFKVVVGTNNEAVDLYHRMYYEGCFCLGRKGMKSVSYTKNGRSSRLESKRLNNYIINNVPNNRTELLKLAEDLNISESNLTKRLIRLGLKYKADYTNCGKYERKH